MNSLIYQKLISQLFSSASREILFDNDDCFVASNKQGNVEDREQTTYQLNCATSSH